MVPRHWILLTGVMGSMVLASCRNATVVVNIEPSDLEGEVGTQTATDMAESATSSSQPDDSTQPQPNQSLPELTVEKVVDLPGDNPEDGEAAGDDPGEGEDPGTGDDPEGEDPGPIEGPSSGNDVAVCDAFAIRPLMSVIDADDYLPTRQWSFSVQEEAIYVYIVMTGIAQGAHEVTLDFHVPAGYLYRRDTVKFKVGEVTGGIQGYPWEYVDAIGLPEGWVITYALPLSGSDIDSFGLTGGWRLAVQLGDDQNPVASVWFNVTE